MASSITLSGRRLVLVTAVVTMLIAFPMGALAVATFSDVPEGSNYYNDIEALAASGVTTGCGGGKYCPKDFVTREQMAAFMNRLGALQSGKTPVVNAAELGGRRAQDLTRVAFNSSSNLLDGDAATAAQLHATIDAPGTGYLTVVGSGAVDYESASGSDLLFCMLRLGGSGLTHTTRYLEVDSVHTAAPCGTSYTFAICGPGIRDVDISFNLVGANTNVTYATISVTYSPFGAGGQQPGCE